MDLIKYMSRFVRSIASACGYLYIVQDRGVVWFYVYNGGTGNIPTRSGRQGTWKEVSIQDIVPFLE
jgi:hypothetical protein